MMALASSAAFSGSVAGLQRRPWQLRHVVRGVPSSQSKGTIIIYNKLMVASQFNIKITADDNKENVVAYSIILVVYILPF